jgi:hypothetical protein
MLEKQPHYPLRGIELLPVAYSLFPFKVLQAFLDLELLQNSSECPTLPLIFPVLL